jgi:hypothetical protein
MARTSNNGGDLRTGESKATKAPAKTPARRRSDKPRPAVASDGIGASTAVARTASVPGMVERAASGGPSDADVARLAYELYVERGCCDGYDKEDWYEAERRLREQR